MMLLNSVKLPYKVVKGSFQYRQTKSARLTNSVMNELYPQLIKPEGITLSKLGRSLKKCFPDNIKLFVCKNRDSDSIAQLNRVFTAQNLIVKQSLELKTNENNRIDFLNIPTLAHEIRHFTDSLFHPKMLAREQILAQKGLDTHKYVNFYENDVYVKETFDGKKDCKRIIKIIKNRTNRILRGLNVQDKIDLLQCIRYNLISERNAYNETSTYAKKIYKKNFPVYEDELNNQNKEFLMNEKIDLYEKMLFSLIKKERGKFSAKLKSKLQTA